MSNTPSRAPAPQRRGPRWLWIGFFISLALNLIVIGGVIGAVWHHHATKAFRDGGVPRHFAAFLRRLPAERRAEFHNILSEFRPLLRPLRAAVRAARQEAEMVMEEQPFDRAAFATANRKLQQRRVALRIKRAEIFTDIVATMTTAERKQFLEWRRKHEKRWRRWRRSEP